MMTYAAVLLAAVVAGNAGSDKAPTPPPAAPAETSGDLVTDRPDFTESSLVVGEGREDIDTVADSLEQIRSAVGEAARRAEEIFEGADTQSMDVRRMVESMQEISRVASRNAEAIDGVAVTSHSQLDSMNRMVASSQSLTGLAEELREALRRFDTGAGGGAA